MRREHARLRKIDLRMANSLPPSRGTSRTHSSRRPIDRRVRPAARREIASSVRSRSDRRRHALRRLEIPARKSLPARRLPPALVSTSDTLPSNGSTCPACRAARRRSPAADRRPLRSRRLRRSSHDVTALDASSAVIDRIASPSVLLRLSCEAADTLWRSDLHRSAARRRWRLDCRPSFDVVVLSGGTSGTSIAGVVGLSRGNCSAVSVRGDRGA